ncbi:MAG TPA: hypothetical protein VLU25_15915, partial [Acidobacteriota bacterium]|nr:hypothetical protein [Acidobacteriota bacterium]
NCPCATCPSSGGGGGGGEEECDNGAAGGAQRLWDAPAIRARSGGGNCEGWDPNTPIIISVRGNQLWLTDLEHGVRFDLDADGFDEALSWTQQGVDDAFLVLDRNGNGQVDEGTELFGTFTPQPPSTNPNGFLALAVFDLADNGGNRDGRISAEDAIFESLQLWVDWNHNGFSEPNELRPLPATRIQAIHLDYRESRRRDQHGNGFRYYSVIDMTPHQQGPRRKFAVDVFLLSDQ